MSAIAVFSCNQVKGFVKFWNDKETVMRFPSLPSGEGTITVEIKLTHLTPGFHGIHIHEYGDLRTETKEGKQECCANVCQHYNPTGAQHGSFKLHGKNTHAGDLCNNVLADKNGTASFVFQYIPDYNKMFEIEDILGRSIVIHANKDDLGVNRDQDPTGSGKTGNAGAKIACAIIGRMKPFLKQEG